MSSDEEKPMEEEEHNGALDWKDSKKVAAEFFRWLYNGDFGGELEGTSLDLTSIDREHVHQLFVAFAQQNPSLVKASKNLSKKDKRQYKRLEGLVMAMLRRQKLLKSKRYNDGVIVCSFARPDHTFAPIKERQTARDVLKKKMEDLRANKNGVLVQDVPTTEPKGDVLPIDHKVTVTFDISTADDDLLKLTKVRLGGPKKKEFHVQTKIPYTMTNANSPLVLSFQAKSMGVYRATVFMTFQKGRNSEPFTILRNVFLRAGDADLYDELKPKSEYVKKPRRKPEKPVDETNVLNPPPPQDAGAGSFKYRDLKHFKVSVDVRELVENREMEEALVPPDYDTNDDELQIAYSTFWQNLLWTSELQAYDDIQLFDMENVTLQRAGKFFKLYVEGLAEGRPSVLRGDLVFCTWGGKQYRGRVFAVELLDVLLEFHPSFHKKFNVSVDRVDLVRFTFSRTAFRTSHAGCLQAPKTMGASMLMPKPVHVEKIKKQQHQRVLRILPQRFAWASQSLNEEQKLAVTEIAKGTLRPMPYCIFGPPGTGKTTTITEAVYQLARLHKYNPKQKMLKILLVAPSNDAADILVEKLSPFFPPSEMMRVLAYTRTIDQVPSLVRPYVREHLSGPKQLVAEIMSVQIVVSTVNLAARFWCTGDGVRKGHFDVLCIDEAGHATEPEAIGVAATLMKFNGQNPGQLVLAGDPQQLGPIITSNLCKKFGMDVSYMERLVKTSPAYTSIADGEATSTTDADGVVADYSPELVTLLVRNYRSHPSILKLPNEMFYSNKLVPCGDNFTTHSMAKWEHLPTKKGFPVVFHAVDGENCREGNSPSWFNPQEAITVVEYVGLLIKHSRPPIQQDEIGVITPYARQVQKIRIALKARDMGDVKVGSVETFQGQERRCIIISTVRSENALLSHDLRYNLGFVANEKRFNVAVTRAKALLVVIGNPRVLQTDTKNWLPFLRFCRENGSWMGEDWDEAAGSGDDTDEEEDGVVLVDNPSGGKNKASEEENDWEVVTEQFEGLGFVNREE